MVKPSTKVVFLKIFTMVKVQVFTNIQMVINITKGIIPAKDQKRKMIERNSKVMKDKIISFGINNN